MAVFFEGTDEWQAIDVMVHNDHRGLFYEAFKSDESLATGEFDVAQANVSVSAKGVFRGLHLMKPGYGQRKYVFCVTGRVLDFALDLRHGSSEFGKFRELVLEPGGKAVFIPNGFAHGFLALEDNSTVVYFCDTRYSPGQEVGINPLDQSLSGFMTAALSKLGMDIPILSAKDTAAPLLEEVLRETRF
jgi:dTDP-4-dehydrorhamnose 3,5-epimerase